MMKRMLWFAALVAGIIALAAPEAGAQGRSRSYTFTGMGEGARLGVMLQDVTAGLKERKKLTVDDGAYVTDVVEDSPAEKAGIQEGDVIVSFDGKTIHDAEDLTRAVNKAASGEAISVGVSRDGEKKTLSATLKKQRRARSFSYSYGGHGPVVIPRIPSMPGRPFHFNIMTSESVEGMELQKLSKQLGEYFDVPDGRGLLVTSVEKRSAAADAGLKAGDVIVKVNSFTVKDVDALRDELYDGDKKTAQLDIVRHGKSQTVSLKVEEREDDGEMEEEDDDDASLNLGVPMLPYMDHSSTHHSLSQANKDFLHELYSTLSQMQERIREKMLRLQERITDRVLNM